MQRPGQQPQKSTYTPRPDRSSTASKRCDIIHPYTAHHFCRYSDFDPVKPSPQDGTSVSHQKNRQGPTVQHTRPRGQRLLLRLHQRRDPLLAQVFDLRATDLPSVRMLPALSRGTTRRQTLQPVRPPSISTYGYYEQQQCWGRQPQRSPVPPVCTHPVLYN